MPIYKKDKTKNGKSLYLVCVNYKDRQGNYKKICRSAYGAAEAKQLELVIKNELKEIQPSDITVLELYNEYIRAVSADIRKTTLEKKERVLKRDIIPHLGDIKLKKLTVKELQNWKNIINSQKLAIRSKQNKYKELHALLNFGVKMDYIPSNPLDKLGNFIDPYSLDIPEEKIRYYTYEQFKKFISAAKEDLKSLNDYGCYVFFNIAFYTGMRKGEINALKWSDIDGNILHIRRSVSQKVKGTKEFETIPKNKSSYRDLQMPQPLIEILDDHKKLQQQEPTWSEDFRICGGISCLSDTSISNKNIKSAVAAALPILRIHDFRHTHASVLINEGINIQEIARRLGHSDTSITWKVYAHLYPREEERAVKILENLDNPNQS